MEAYMFYKTLY